MFCGRELGEVFYRVFLRVSTDGTHSIRRKLMNGYLAQRRGRFYVVIYEGRDPVTGKELRRWHPAGADRAEAERLAEKLAVEETRRVQAIRSLTFGAYLTGQWLPAKKLHLATSTYKGYERNVRRHVLPVLGRTGLRRLRYQQIESLYDALLHPTQGEGLSPKTVYEIHLLIRGALADALRRGLVSRNVALLARAPKQRALQTIEGKAWTDTELRTFVRAAAGHRFFPILWLTAMTGMRRNEVLGLRWPDIDFKKRRVALNRGLVAVGYELHQTRGKTRTARRNIDLDDTTLTVPPGLAGLPDRRVRRRRHRQRRGVGVHRWRRRADPPPRPLPDL
ncbi:MAG: site-specific integrase [Acidimicrobiia bacterium]|nr:site-specific integrase [Acidimicrobiia bacterium]